MKSSITSSTIKTIISAKRVVKPSLHEQFLCDKLYLTIFICLGKPRLHEQFLCDKFYLFASVRPVYTSNFYLKTKDWRLGSMDDCQSYICVVPSTRTILCM